ncbi:DUF4381 domain-containing protein [Porticoccus sp. W117]|uniref:DUF4381 domain-containing protein n=1 Tax=Porticoccus sp. W117 TaxID=3054777 RepID=UPI00259A7105|nr:DUF4381 domain-containing protein [Porticoccus sp. W117]MDM3871090.1 DUF4381 domain-containing protein [Porticoccus sp. W117]
MNGQTANPLAQLRDIHLPEATGWWPLAPGLWALLIAVAVLLAFGLWLWWRRFRRNRYRRLAQRMLSQHFADFHNHQNQSTLCQQLVATLRRCLLSSGNQTLRLASSQPTAQLLQARGRKGQHYFSQELAFQVEQQLYAGAPAPLSTATTQELQRSALQWIAAITTLQFGGRQANG